MILAMALLLVGINLAACGGSRAADKPAQVSASTTDSAANTQNTSLALQPASGYGGLYVQVSGDNWPQNMMVLVTLEDDKGRSETLAASDTDQEGHLNTGFLFPIDERWLASASPWVVTTTADGRMEAKAQFTVVPPGSEIAEASPEVATGTSADTAGKAMTDTTAISAEEEGHTLALPLVVSSGAERGANRRGGRSSPARSGGVTQVDIDIKAEGTKSIDCRKGDQWITVVIWSAANFDATTVDPGSVVVAGGSSELGYRRDAAVDTLVSLTLPNAVQSNLHAYQWRWHLDDVDKDGKTDMVMEFQLDYTELTCDAAAVAVTGRTQDGKAFEGSNQVDMLVLDRG
jgi:hypothetical protein